MSWGLYSFRKILFYVLLLGMTAMTVSSCGGSKSASMRQIERHSKKYPDPSNMEGVAATTKSRKIKQAIKKQEKIKKDEAKAAKKREKRGAKSHRDAQTKETLQRMDRHKKEANKRYTREFFLVRWMRPKTDAEKIEKRQNREAKQRMDASRRKSEKTNRSMGRLDTDKSRERKAKKTK